ncbi:MAG TPA: 2-hydroxy-acid oxidase, partial [Clostridiales bacterium]|nr:2-hydroxy-acid oxidase [Clostridiales bacterium]
MYDMRFEYILLDALGENRVLTGSAIGLDYAHDETPGGVQYMPEAVCLAKSTEDVSAILKLCNEYDIPVTPRGAGTGLVGGSVPVNGGIVLALGGMNRILGYDEEAMTV